MTRRRSLRDFDDEAIATDLPRIQTGATEAAAATVVAPHHSEPPRSRRPQASAGASSQERTGIYLQAATFAAARSAYIADFESVAESPVTFGGWLAGVLDRHARRSPRSRAALADQVPAETVGGGVNRAFILPAATVQAMHEAIAADRRAGNIASRSQFASVAIRSAIEDSRGRAGGELPPAPARLPNKLR
jgi:hypothetical protein